MPKLQAWCKVISAVPTKAKQAQPDHEGTLRQAPRRLFVLNAVTACAALAGARLAAAQTTPALVKDDEPTAVALGYVTDAANIDVKKQPVYVPGSSCGSCALFQGKAGDVNAPCPVFGGKQVAAKGWCTGWSKKA